MRPKLAGFWRDRIGPVWYSLVVVCHLLFFFSFIFLKILAKGPLRLAKLRLPLFIVFQRVLATTEAAATAATTTTGA